MMIIPKETQDSAGVARHYDELDHIYRQLWGNHLHHGLWLTGKESSEQAVLQLVELLAGRLGINRGWNVCDIGCGYGATAKLMADHWDASVTGLTLSEAQYLFAISQDPASANLRFMQRDWLDNRLPPSHFDAAYAIESSEHMVDKTKFCQECFRVLRPGGRLGIFAWLAKENPKPWEVRYLLEPICREGRLPSMGSVESYRALLADSGFHDIRYEDLTKNVKRTWTICIARSLRALLANSEFRAYLFSGKTTERGFWKSVFRIRLAYAFGSMRYGFFTARK